MPNRETATAAANFFGDKLYQQRARQALPLLVRQAQTHKTIFYSELAAELRMPNPRNLNYVLGCVGQTLISLAAQLGKQIPPLQCLVINQATELPGNGVSWFIERGEFAQLTKKQKRVAVEVQLQKIFLYPEWGNVLDALDLRPIPAATSAELLAASQAGRKGGESEHHRLLKEYIWANPSTIGLPKSTDRREMEYPIASGDTLDVFFESGNEWVAVEVKSHISDVADIRRGLFQCVKYQAVLESMQAVLGLPQNVRVVLALSNPLPGELYPIRNALAVETLVVIQPDQ